MANTQVVQFAKNAGFDSIFIELEHSSLTIDNANALCLVGLLSKITPFVRVPHQCGNGFVQRILDGGAMGVIFPHIQTAGMSELLFRDIIAVETKHYRTKEEAKAAVSICKYPSKDYPHGCRSMTGQLPVWDLKPTPSATVISETNASASSVFLMVENKATIENIDKIAAVPGVDVLLVGSNDLSIELGVPSGFRTETFRSALEAVGKACKRHGKIMGLAGIYDQPDLQGWAIKELGVRWILCQQDSGLIAGGAVRCAEAIADIE